MKKIEGTIENFDELIQEDFVVVKFFATWCGPCKMLAPVVEEAAKERNLTIVEVDIDNSVDIASKYAVMSVPTLMIFKNGELKNAHTGFMPKEQFIKWVEESK